MRGLIVLFSALLPWFVRRPFLELVCGYNLHPSSKIGLSYISCEMLELGENASIGSFTVIRDTPIVKLGDNSTIGAWNWITTIPCSGNVFKSSQNRIPRLIMGRDSSITSRHYIDVQDSIDIGDFVTLAGVRSNVFTHGIDVALNAQIAKPVAIGDFSYIGTNVTILSGVNIPSKCVIAGGSVVNRDLHESGLYAGVPAKLKKSIDPSAEHFVRLTGAVD